MLRRTLGLVLVAAAALFLAQASAAPHASPPPTAAGIADSPRPKVEAATTAPTAAAIPPGYRVRVPRLGIDLPIAEGVIQRDIDDQQTPEGYAFHLPGTGIPGEGTNTYLYAHARIGMFLSLWNAQVGDDVTITAPDATVFRYVVSAVRPRVPPTDVSVAQPTPDERLTLQTSTGPDPTDARFVVIALPRL